MYTIEQLNLKIRLSILVLVYICKDFLIHVRDFEYYQGFTN